MSNVYKTFLADLHSSQADVVSRCADLQRTLGDNRTLGGVERVGLGLELTSDAKISTGGLRTSMRICRTCTFLAEHRLPPVPPESRAFQSLFMQTLL